MPRPAQVGAQAEEKQPNMLHVRTTFDKLQMFESHETQEAFKLLNGLTHDGCYTFQFSPVDSQFIPGKELQGLEIYFPFLLLVLQKAAQPTYSCELQIGCMWLTRHGLATPGLGDSRWALERAAASGGFQRPWTGTDFFCTCGGLPFPLSRIPYHRNHRLNQQGCWFSGRPRPR